MHDTDIHSVLPRNLSGGAAESALPTASKMTDFSNPDRTTDFSGTPLEKLVDDGMFRHFRPLYKGTLIANVKMDRDRGNRLITEGLADLVAFGRPYIANPDLVQRFADNTPLAEVDWETVY